MSVSLENKLILIDSFQFLCSSLCSSLLVKYVGENAFKHLNQDFDSKILDLVKQKRFFSYEHMCNLEKFNET